MVLAPVPAPAQLPSMGDGGDVTLGTERKIGERIARELYRDPDFIDDPLLSDYIQRIWQPLLAAARARGDLSADLEERFAWEILIGRDRSVNAFALPGGYLGVNLGLIAVVSNRDELASVLAHEMSHVTQRHIARMMGQQSRNTPLLIAAMVLGALAAAKSPAAGNAMMAGGQGLLVQNQLNFSRDMEREADRVGYNVMTQAGFAPQGFVTMFGKLQQASRLNDNGSFPYLRSHPMNTERIADMQARLQLDPPPAAPVAVTLEHAMMAARARVLMTAGAEAARARVGEVSSPGFATFDRPRRAATLYGAAYAAASLRDYVQARGLVAQLIELVGQQPVDARLARLLAAEIELNAGNPRGALASVDDRAADRSELLLGAQARIGAGQAADAAGRLQTWVANQPRDATAWQTLSAAYAAQGQTLRAIRAEAESHAARLDYQAAVDRFRAAQEFARTQRNVDYIEASIIDTRAREVAALLREQALER